MKPETIKKLEELKNYLQKIHYLEHALTILSLDRSVSMPRDGLKDRGEVLGFLSNKVYNIITSDDFKNLIYSFKEEDLDFVSQRGITRLKKYFEDMNKVPEDRQQKWIITTSEAQSKWEEAKIKDDYSIFKPSLEEIINMTREFVEYYGYEENPYDALLDKYQSGLTVKKLDKVFYDLKEGLVDILNKLKESNVIIKEDFLKKETCKTQQKELCMYVLNKIGFDFNSGVVAESEHPFTTNTSNKDIRLTVKYVENNFTKAIFSSIHEGGHGIYEQNIPESLSDIGLNGAASMSVHESQSRFYENIIGRSYEFWKGIYPKTQEIVNHLKDVSLDDFYKAINKVEPSLVRIKSDEVTYNLHIIIRYELEKMIINGEVNLNDLPELWNKKYNEYLGMNAENYEDGILQDMHWGAGMFGYFPSYALGNIYSAQFLNAMLKDMPNMYEEIGKGDLAHVNKWLRENIHCHGEIYDTDELLKKVTGEELNCKYFLDYLRNKYSKIYNVSL